jgi:hypothetical protein
MNQKEKRVALYLSKLSPEKRQQVIADAIAPMLKDIKKQLKSSEDKLQKLQYMLNKRFFKAAPARLN